MPIFLLPLPVLAIAGIFYFIVSRKSTPLVRRVAIIAFILAVLTILVCSVFILSRPAAVTGPHYSTDTGETAPPAAPLNITLIIGTLLVFFFFVILIIVAARREQRRRTDKQPL
jgi:4-amino-4-deoxy-L-arabinose transferase-like glycosyltransferase